MSEQEGGASSGRTRMLRELHDRLMGGAGKAPRSLSLAERKQQILELLGGQGGANDATTGQQGNTRTTRGNGERAGNSQRQHTGAQGSRRIAQGIATGKPLAKPRPRPATQPASQPASRGESPAERIWKFLWGED